MWWDRVAVGNTRIGPASAVIDNVDPFVPEFLTTNPATKTISWSASFDPVPGSGLAGIIFGDAIQLPVTSPAHSKPSRPLRPRMSMPVRRPA